MIGVVVSRADEASVAIWEQLHDLVPWDRHRDDILDAAAGGGEVYRHGDIEVRTFEELHLHLQRPAAAFDDPELVVFVSRHAGDTGRLLTAHYPGNFGEAAYGGLPGTLPAPAPRALSTVYDALRSYAPSEYAVGIECTHHGPTDVGAPTMFVELGSDPEAWNDPDGAAAVARAVIQLSGCPSHDDRTLVGVGGGHYAPKFERIVRETDWDVGHIAAEWALVEIGDPALQVERVEDGLSCSNTDLVVVDGEYESLVERLTSHGYRVVGETWVRATDGVDRDVIATVERRLGPVEAGTRFGDCAAKDPDSMQARRLPAELLGELQGLDPDAARAVIRRHSVAFDTSESGNRLEPRILVPSDAAYNAIVDDAVAVLAEHHETVERQESAVIVRSERFDPDAARALGVPEGPKFGALAEGESIELDGATIEPAAVTAVHERRLPLTTD